MTESRGAYLRKLKRRAIREAGDIKKLIDNQQTIYDQLLEKITSLGKELNEWERGQ